MSKDTRARRPAPAPRRRPRALLTLLLAMVVIAGVVAVAWPGAGTSSTPDGGEDHSSDNLDAPVCTRLEGADPGSTAPDGASGPPGDSNISTCPADSRTASAMLHVTIGDPGAVPPGWTLTESTVLLQQNPDGSNDQQFHRIWRPPGFTPGAASCAPKIILDAHALAPADKLDTSGPQNIPLGNGVTANGLGFQNTVCQAATAVPGLAATVHWQQAGVVYELFTFAVPQAQVLAFAASV
jgi:hypothetical protein